MKNDITKLSAFELGALLSKKKIDPVVLIEVFLENYKKAKPYTKNAICKILKKEAFIQAEFAWNRQKHNNRLSFFDGIPSGWKDVIDIENFPAFAGSKLLAKQRKKLKVQDAKVVANAKKNGVIPLFKTSTVEFAFGGLGLNNSVKYPRNQIIKNNYCPGGSSSGSAAAVSSNLVPLAVGTDTAGSVRIPSCWHSLIGFKPTYNNIPTEGILPLSKSYDTVGTICKSVKDTLIFYSILSEKGSIPKFTKKKYTIGVLDDFIVEDLHKKDDIIFNDFITRLKFKNFNLKKISIPEFKLANRIIEDQGGTVNFEAWNYWKDYIKNDTTLVDKNVLSRFQLGANMSKKTYLNINQEISKLKTKIYKYFEDFEFMLLPTLSINPPKVRDVLEDNKYKFYNNRVLSNTRIANLFNLSAITVPIIKGYWLSYTILALENNDNNLLEIAQKIEDLCY